MPDFIVIPAPYINMSDARLYVESDAYGDSYRMRLEHDGETIAEASEFRPGAAQDFGTDPEHAIHTVGTFGAFLSAAVESEGFRTSWEVFTDAASDWADALVLMGDRDARIAALREEVAEARRLGRDPQRQLCELEYLTDEGA